MYLEKIEIIAVPECDIEIAQTLVAELDDLELSLVGGGMGDVVQ